MLLMPTSNELQTHLCLHSLFIVPDMSNRDITSTLVNYMYAGHAAQYPATMQRSLMVQRVVQLPHVVAAQPSATPGAYMYMPTVQVIQKVQIVPIMPTGYVQPVPLMPSVYEVPTVPRIHRVPRVYEIPTVPAEAQTESPRWNEAPNNLPEHKGN